MQKNERKLIPKEKIIVVKRNKKKLDFSKKYKFIYFEWWFHLVTLPIYLIYVLITLLGALYFGLRITGFKNRKILRKQGCIIISNHCHYFDSLFVNCFLLPHRVYTSVAQRNFEIPFIRRVLRFAKAFPIPSSPMLFNMIHEPVKEALRRKQSILFLPEGDLVYLSQEIYRFKPGAFYMSYINQVPILPTVLVITKRRLFGKEKSPHWPKMRMVIGEPFSPPPLRKDNAFPKEELDMMMEKSAKWMENTIAYYHSLEEK